MEINHFSHKHPLWPMKFSLHRFVCNACKKSFSGYEMYECESCAYRLDKTCLNFPHKFLNPYHPHTLYAELNQGIEFECNACGRQIPHGIFYRCLHCNLNLDVTCAFYKPRREDLHHFSHFHPLTRHEIEFERFVFRQACSLCKIFHLDQIPTYVCLKCDFYAHQQCSMMKLPREIQHPSYQCFLTLSRTRPYYGSLPLNYRCENCKFTVELDGALDYFGYKGEKQLRHFSHRHPLELTEQNNEDGQVSCSACRKSYSAPTYGCITCQYFLHQTCIDLPLEIRHFFHPCPLFLCIQPNSFTCGACDMTIQGFYFYCEWCNFSMDIECALLPTRKSQSDEQFCHLSHGHPLTLSEIKDDDQVYCSVCRRCSADPAFVCRKCCFFLDKSCFDHLQPEIQYAFHPCHPLVLQGKPTKVKSVCNVCCKNLNGPTYHCELCDFEIHMECSLPMPTVSYKGHNHFLLFLETIDTEVKCNSCDTTCDSSVFHCVECDFNLHLMCGPLPCTIQPECHYHPFILTDSPLDDESEEFYCDVCEKERDPRLSVYYCKECFYPAEIKCVMSEVMLTLKGCCGEVELRSLDGQISGKVISKSIEVKSKEKVNSNNEAGKMKIKLVLTMDDMLASLKTYENEEFKGVLEASRRDVAVVGETSSDDHSQDSELPLFSCSDLVTAFSGCKNMETDGILTAPGSGVGGTEISTSGHRDGSDGNLKISQFSDSTFKHFMRKLDSSPHYSTLILWEGNEEVVNVGDNWIPRKFVPILKDLCSKHENFSAESTLSPRVKHIFIVMLCGTMHSMCNTRIIDISENLLLNWWNNLKTLKFAGFKVQFAFDHLQKVVRAYFGLQVDKSEVELDIKMSKLSKVIEQLTIEFKELKETREFIALAKASKSNIMKDCLIEASTKKWRPAGTGLD